MRTLRDVPRAGGERPRLTVVAPAADRPSTAPSTMPVTIVAIGIVWFVAALALAAAGPTARLRPPAPQLVLFGLTAALIAAWWLAPSFRRWLLAIDLRALVALHVTRFVGLYFLWAYSKGLLPFAFAVPGGAGDIVV